MADNLNQCKCCGGMGCDVCNYGSGFDARRSSSSVSEGEMPKADFRERFKDAYLTLQVAHFNGPFWNQGMEELLAAIDAEIDRRAATKAAALPHVQRYTNNGDGTMVENPEGVWCYYEDATKAAAPDDAPRVMSYAEMAKWARDNGLNVPPEWERMLGELTN